MKKNFDSKKLFLSRAKLIMKFLGVWVPQENESIFSKLYRIFMITLQFLFLIFQMVYIVMVWGNLEAVSQASYLLFTQACLCFKIVVFHVNIEKVRDMLDQMGADVFKPMCEKHEKILKLQATRIKRFLFAFMISSQTTCGLWALKPLFDDGGSRQFPFDMWMPVTPDGSVQYVLGYSFQLMTICMSAYMYFGVDSVCLGMVIFGCAQIEIIKDKLMRIKSPAAEEQATHEQLDVVHESNYTKLVECIVHHQAVVTLTQLVEDSFHTFLLFQLNGSVGLICMSALRIFVIEWRSMQFASILSYLSVMISLLFVNCWCGNELTATSESLHTVLYESAWYEQDIKYKRTLCFMMLRMSKPLFIKAGHYITLSRQTFVTILRMSYSYFAVLNQTASKN